MNIEHVDTKVDQLRVTFAEHDGRMTAYWESQKRCNERDEKKFSEIYLRINSLERRVVVLATIASAVGAVLGTFLR